MSDETECVCVLCVDEKPDAVNCLLLLLQLLVRSVGGYVYHCNIINIDMVFYHTHAHTHDIRHIYSTYGVFITRHFAKCDRIERKHHTI